MVENNLYSSIEDDTLLNKESKYNEENKLMVEHLKQTERFVHAFQLASLSGFPTGNNQVQMRLEITRLQLHGVPILGSQQGYSFCLEPNMWNKQIEALERRIKGLERRKEAYMQIMNALPNYQEVL